MLRITTRAALALALACAVGACKAKDESEEQLPQTANDSAPALNPVTTELATWDVHFDKADADAGTFQMAEQPAGGWVIQTGSGGAAVTWRDRDMVESGGFHVGATFGTPTVADPKDVHGIFVGGRNLKDPDQAYTAFLIRGTGEYTVERREGGATKTLQPWTSDASIRASARAGEIAPNTLEIRVQADQTRFLVNGTQVHALPTEEASPYGIAGLRVDSDADVTVTSFEMGAQAAATTPAP